MKKLYNKKGKVHPSPSPSSSSSSLASSPSPSDHLLAFLPATILYLCCALSPQDKEVLAYLISCSTTTPPIKPKKTTPHHTQKGVLVNGVLQDHLLPHPPLFNCNCFLCYTSYWVKWDSSPNRQLIHDIIDAFEDELDGKLKKMKNKKDRKKKGSKGFEDLKRFDDESGVIGRVDSAGELESFEENAGDSTGGCDNTGGGGGGGGEEEEKGTVGKFVNFLGEKIWGVWG